MIRSCSPTGQFVYKVDPDSGEQRGTYNIVRHAGAMYALGMLFTLQPSKDVADALGRSAEFLRHVYTAPVPGTTQLAVWSNPFPQNDTAQLGATGLGLVALAAAQRAGQTSVPISDLQAMGHFLVALQRADGSFVHKYNRFSGAIPNWESLYYPGEAALGLIQLYQLDGDEEWLLAASKALSFLAESRGASIHVPPDHWALIAISELLPLSTPLGINVSQAKLMHYANQVVAEILREQSTDPTDRQIFGSFGRGRTAPTATSLEGLLAASTFLSPLGIPQKTQIEQATGLGIKFLLHAQIPTGFYSGALPGGPLDHDEPSARYLRIDFVQHTLSAYVRYLRLNYPVR